MSAENPTPSGESDLRTALTAQKKKRRTVAIAVGAVAVVGLVAGTVAIVANLGGTEPAANAAEASAASDDLSVTIATAEDSVFQDTIAEVAAEKGLEVEWLNVDDWVLPNTELVAGTVDANAFQHILYLSAFNTENDADITPVFSTVITQWGIFSATLDDVDALADGARIGIPDDPSNGGRALNILESAGLIQLSDDAGDFPTVDDIESNERNLQFVPLPARDIPLQFEDPSLAAVIVGTGGDDVDNPAWDILQEAYADPRVAEALEEEYFGNTVLVDVDIDDLRAKLADLEAAAAQG